MHHPTHLLAGAVCLLTATSLHAQIVVASDNFETTDHPTGDRTVVSGGINGIRFYTRNATGAGYTANIVDDSGAGGLGSKALNHTDATGSSAGNQIIGLFPQAFTLAVAGDYIELDFSFRFTNGTTATSSATAFRFGIEGSNGTVVSGDNQGATSDNDRGYYVQTGVGTSGPLANNVFFVENGGTTAILGGNDRTAISSSGGVAFNTNVAHTVAFRITRGTGANMSVSVAYDGGTPITGTTATTAYYTFDEIAFTGGFATPNIVNFNLDNISVTMIPEPSSLTLLGVGMISLVGTVRRRKPMNAVLE